MNTISVSAPAIARILNKHGLINKKHTIGQGYFIKQAGQAVFVSMHLRSWSDEDVQRYNDTMDRIQQILNQSGYSTEARLQPSGLREFKVYR